MSTLVPIKDEIASIILNFVRIKRAEISPKQAHALMRYARDPFIMQMMQESWFRHWFNEGERVGTVQTFTRQVIEDLLEVYK